MLRSALSLASAAVLLATLTACGSSSATDPAAAAASSTADPGTGDAGGAAPRAFPGTSGTIAAVDGMTLQVQNDQTGQVAVTYTATTGITAQVDGDLADIAVGSCVRVQSATDAADGDAESDADTPVAATTVTVVAAVDGSCAAGGAAGGALVGLLVGPVVARAQTGPTGATVRRARRPSGPRVCGTALDAGWSGRSVPSTTAASPSSRARLLEARMPPRTR